MRLTYHQLSRHLDSGKLEPVYLVMGEQELLRELAVDMLATAAVGGEPTPFNSDRFDGQQARVERILDSANVLPLLGGRRGVVVRRASRLVESEQLAAYLEDPSPHSVLVLDLEKRPDQRKKSWKQIAGKASVVTCDAPRTSGELEDWLTEQAKGKGLSLVRPVVRYLASEFGSDLRRLVNELEKLSLYAAGDKLDLETVAFVIGRGKAQNIFKFVEALESRDSAKALRQLGRLLAEGEPPLRILALVDRLVSQLRVTKEVQGSGGRASGLAGVLGVPPFVAKRLSESARRYDREALERAVQALADTDRRLKSTSFPGRVVLETLVMALGSPASQ
ncbi:MAG TPA: DNA polymerase III subunit delta, partial [Vicinamibacteria bacterium]|nr:DNA polymerase III subunit delta [Vicinamibacteria bacterium]